MHKELIGRRVRIYQDPITRLDFEGEAIVENVEHLDSKDPQYQAFVRFDPSEDVYFRTFGEQDLI